MKILSTYRFHSTPFRMLLNALTTELRGQAGSSMRYFETELSSSHKKISILNSASKPESREVLACSQT